MNAAIAHRIRCRALKEQAMGRKARRRKGRKNSKANHGRRPNS